MKNYVRTNYNDLGKSIIAFLLHEERKGIFEANCLDDSIKITITKSISLSEGYYFSYEASKENNESIYLKDDKVAIKFFNEYVYFDNENDYRLLFYCGLPETDVGISYNYFGTKFHHMGTNLVKNLSREVGSKEINICTLDEYICDLSNSDKFFFLDENMLTLIYIYGDYLISKSNNKLNWGYLDAYDNMIFIPVMKYEDDYFNITDFLINKLLYEEHKQRTINSILDSIKLILIQRYNISI